MNSGGSFKVVDAKWMDMVIEKGDSTLPGELPASSAASMRDDHMTLELPYVIILVITRHLRQRIGTVYGNEFESVLSFQSCYHSLIISR